MDSQLLHPMHYVHTAKKAGLARILLRPLDVYKDPKIPVWFYGTTEGHLYLAITDPTSWSSCPASGKFVAQLIIVRPVVARRDR